MKLSCSVSSTETERNVLSNVPKQIISSMYSRTQGRWGEQGGLARYQSWVDFVFLLYPIVPFLHPFFVMLFLICGKHLATDFFYPLSS